MFPAPSPSLGPDQGSEHKEPQIRQSSHPDSVIGRETAVIGEDGKEKERLVLDWPSLLDVPKSEV